jgi:riboflavin kinase
MQKLIGEQDLQEQSEGLPGPEASTTSPSAFVEHQRRVFDGMAGWFASDEAIPSGLRPAYRHLANRILRAAIDSRSPREAAAPPDSEAQPRQKRRQRRALRLLDVGCGTGALFPFLREAVKLWNDGHEAGAVQLRVTGVDLSPNMIAEARDKYRDWLKPAQGDDDNNDEEGDDDVILEDLIASDVLEYAPLPEDVYGDSAEPKLFDVIVLNACFGNFLDPRDVVEHLAAMLARPGSGAEGSAPDADGDGGDVAAEKGPTWGGRICVTHPLGADFVRKLHEECADTVPHELPTRRGWQSSLLLGLPLVLAGWEDRMESETGSSDPIYYAEIHSVRYRALPDVMRLRGAVASGFGRGGKKLGFPTANLGPTRAFEKALEAADTGVYFGWALVEKEDEAQPSAAGSAVHKAVVNVGFSPTFQEQNPAKIVEAHLILEDESTKRNLGDFYNQTLRLELIGYLRPELKFPSFPALIAQITSDRSDASRALGQAPYSWFRSDPFLTVRMESGTWVGCTGGGADASWEFAPLAPTLETLPQRFEEE